MFSVDSGAWGFLPTSRASGPRFKMLRGGVECPLMKTIHVSEMIAEGGRDGRVESADGALAVELSSDENSGKATPEHLFAGAYAACFLGSLKNQAEKARTRIEGLTVTGRAHLEEDARGDYQLHMDLRAAMPGVSRTEGAHLMNLAHQSCPYSKATRGNVVVNLSFD